MPLIARKGRLPPPSGPEIVATTFVDTMFDKVVIDPLWIVSADRSDGVKSDYRTVLASRLTSTAEITHLTATSKVLIVLKKSLLASEISSRPLVRFARRYVRAHIVSYKDHGTLATQLCRG
jgi:hypothetical protein